MQKLVDCILSGVSLLVLGFSVGLFSFLSPVIAGERVIASTPLVGAIAKAAGAREVRVISPEGTRHPPEYDLKPSDLLMFQEARMVIYGGYERMVPKLLETSREKGILALRIETETSPDTLIASARKVSQALGTEKEEGVWEKQFTEKLEVLQKNLSPLSGKRAIAHRYAYPFCKWANLSILQMIPPGELTPKIIADAIAQKPELVVDVFHFPIARVIAENANCKYIQIINFPGVEGAKTLEDVFEYNSMQLIKGFR